MEAALLGRDPGTLHDSLQQFYAWQAQLLDAGLVDRWAGTFADEAVMVQKARRDRQFTGNAPPDRRGRLAIAQAARGAVQKRAGTGVTRRYWIGMLSADLGRDRRVRTRFYAMLVETPPGGNAGLFLSASGEDILVHTGRWQVERRTLFHDDVGI